MKILLTMRVEIPATPDSCWFSEEDVASMTDAQILGMLNEDIVAAMEGATWMIERIA